MQNFNALLDNAIQELRPLQRRVLERRMRNPENRQMVADECMLHVCTKLDLPVLATATPDTPLQFDPETIKKILDLLIEYLPKVISLIKLFM